MGALPNQRIPARKALAEICNAEDRRHILDAVKAFQTGYGAKLPKAVAKITDDLRELLAPSMPIPRATMLKPPGVSGDSIF